MRQYNVGPKKYVRLTRLNMEHAAMLANGLSREDIAEVQHVSLNTVKTMLKHLYAKVGAHSALQLIMELQRRKLLVWDREREHLVVNSILFGQGQDQSPPVLS